MDLQWTIDGRRFRTPEEYEAAKRDKQLIDSITRDLKLNNPKDIEKLYQQLKSSQIEFESIVGRQFDDNIYELHRRVQEEQELKQEEIKRKKEERMRKKEQKKNVSVSSKREKVRLEDLSPEMKKEVLQEIRKKEKRRKLLIGACIPVCVICFGYFVFYYQSSAKSTNEFEALAALKNTAVSSQVILHKTSAENAETLSVLPEYETLYSKNKKLIGWIKIDDTIIDYPVMQTVNNEYYLNHNFNQEEDKNGCIFMDYQCDAVNGCDNIILYGHHMQSGKMFGTLNKYSSEAYYEEHPKIQFDTIYNKGEYEVMYVFRSKVYSEEEVAFKYYQFINAGSAKEFDSYMNEMAALSLYDTGVTATYGDKLLTLSNCDYQENEGRFVVVAKRVN